MPGCLSALSVHKFHVGHLERLGPERLLRGIKPEPEVGLLAHRRNPIGLQTGGRVRTDVQIDAAVRIDLHLIHVERTETRPVQRIVDESPSPAVVHRQRPELLLIDGEAVVLGVDGISDFEALCSRKHDAEVQLYAFYVLALDGEDLRRLPLSMRKTNLDRLSARRPEGKLHPSSRARSAATYSAPLARWDWKAWFRSGEIAPIVTADARTGSRSRTRRRWR